MNKHAIAAISAQEILDSRGDPTIRATVTLKNGEQASADVPAGASTGRHEALELRDGGARYRGKGVRRAVTNVSTVINDVLKGMAVEEQPAIDRKLVGLDGTPDRSRLGANAILSVSLACARAAATAERLPLYEYLQQRFRLKKPKKFPRPMCNVLNGGRHADNNVSFQEFHVLAHGKTFAEQIERTWRVIQCLKDYLRQRHDRTLVGDEGGFAPLLKSNEEGLKLLVTATKESELRLGDDIEFGLDVAASEFYSSRSGTYRLSPDNRELEPGALIEMYQGLAERYPLTTLEDGLSEDDWQNWSALTKRLGEKLMLIGDDLFATQRERLSQGIRAHAGNAILIKPNQVGTLSETMETIAVARDDGYEIVVSHRSGETSDDFIADLAVAVGSRFLKAGSLMRGERLAKYNRLLTIAAEVGG